MAMLKGTLEQWQVLQAVVDNGGYAQAAEVLHRSQSSVSYTITKLQEQLGIALLFIDGRKARLTPAGEILLQRSRHLIDDAVRLEQLAGTLTEGREAEIRVVVDVAFPTDIITAALQRFANHSHGTLVQLEEVVLSGADDAVREGRADLAIAAAVPQGFLGDAIAEIEFIAVASPHHPLHQLGRALTNADLQRERQVVIRDSGLRHRRDSGWLGAHQRWTVSRIETAISLIRNGLGFGWLPRHQIAHELRHEALKPLPLREGQRCRSWLYLLFGRKDCIGPATQQFAQILRETALAFNNAA